MGRTQHHAIMPRCLRVQLLEDRWGHVPRRVRHNVLGLVRGRLLALEE